MAVEANFLNTDLSRRDFIDFAGKRRKNKRESSKTPEPPSWNPFGRVSRRGLLIGGAAGGVGLWVANRLGLLRPSEPQQPETIESLVVQAKKAATNSRQRKITINAASDSFKQVNIARTEGMPINWNPLKMLRLSFIINGLERGDEAVVQDYIRLAISRQ